MIPAKHTWFHIRFFRWYTNCRIRRNFSNIVIHEPFNDLSDKPLLIIANHFSWWDGFFILWLNNRYLKKQFHVMMLEDQLRENMILNKIGAFSIKKNSRDMVESLNYARNILRLEDLKTIRRGEAKTLRRGEEKTLRRGDGKRSQRVPLLLMYPQGEIQSMHSRELKFEKGIEHITSGLEGKINILMVVVLIDYFSEQKPQVHFYFQQYPFQTSLSSQQLEITYNQFLLSSSNHQITTSSNHQVIKSTHHLIS
jgi:hypothetical protein